MTIKGRESAEAFALQRGFVIQELLGDGLHGNVWKVVSQDRTYQWVVKLHQYLPAWRREVLCYERLRQMNTFELRGVSIPRMLSADETWQSIEMTTVTAPFLLDFGSAWLDERPDFPPEVWEQAEEQAAEKFEKDMVVPWNPHSLQCLNPFL